MQNESELQYFESSGLKNVLHLLALMLTLL